MDDATVFSSDPGAMARHWLEAGARRLHLVDLNGAFAGKPKNGPRSSSITDVVGDDIPVQLGGGIRDLDTIERYLDNGISYVIIGTAAVKNPASPARRLRRLPRPHHRRPRRQDGKVAVDGWSKLTGHDVIDLAKVRGLRRRGGDLHRHRPRRHAVGRQYRGHRASWRRRCASRSSPAAASPR